MEIQSVYLHYQPSNKLSLWIFLLILFLTGASISNAQTLQDGIYTEAQAERGAEDYAARCASCHSIDLRGNSNSPSLIGLSFMFIWEGRSLGELFNKMSEEMPTEDPGSLTQQSYAAILAYILESNEFPSGDTDLASNAEALAGIQITSQYIISSLYLSYFIISTILLRIIYLISHIYERSRKRI